MRLFAVLLAFMFGCGTIPLTPIERVPSNIPVQTVHRLYGANGKKCSGVAISETLLVTAAHCGPGPFASVSPDEMHIALVLHSADPAHDAQVLELSDGQQFHSWAPIARARPVPGEHVTTVGYGCRKIRDARTATYRASLEVNDAFEGRVCQGDSGGAVFNERGELVNIMNSFLPGGDVFWGARMAP